MVKNEGYTAQGYRMPKPIFKDLLIGILTLGFKGSSYEKEEAKTYLYIIEENQIRIIEEKLNGKNEEVARKILESIDEKEKIMSKRKFVEGAYIYYIDKETMK